MGKTHEFRASGSPLSNTLMQICADSNPSLTKQSAMHSYTFSEGSKEHEPLYGSDESSTEVSGRPLLNWN